MTAWENCLYHECEAMKFSLPNTIQGQMMAEEKPAGTPKTNESHE